nr:hypothetical protein [Tanacetum cinerariifolium]
HAAVQQTGLAVELLGRQRQAVGRPLQHGQVGRAGESGAAHDVGAALRQAQREAGLGIGQRALGAAAGGAAQHLHRRAVPAADGDR